MTNPTDPRIEAVARARFNHTRKKVMLERPGVSIVDFDQLHEKDKEYWKEGVTEELKAADEAAWPPIESAPKDGTYVDLWVIDCDDNGRRMTDAFFGPIPNSCGEMGGYCDCCPEEGSFWIDGIFGERLSGTITHWRPLPESPKP